MACDPRLSLRPRKLTLKGYRQHWVVFKETTLSYYKSQDEAPGDPIQQLNLKGERGAGQGVHRLPPPRAREDAVLRPLCRWHWPRRLSGRGPPLRPSNPPLLPPGCEVVPDVNVSGQKFCIKLLVPSPEGMSELYLRCQDVRAGRAQGGPRRERGRD